MRDLTPYAAHFDDAYASYADGRYGEILKLVERYDQPDILRILESPQFQTLVALVEPLIEIKNYKSQIPFPRDIVKPLSCIARIRATPVSPSDPFADHASLFVELLELQGFQLPTASAVFHFCHPAHFPIVDINVEAACAILLSTYPSDFHGLAAPRLPSALVKAHTKLARYRLFIDFLRRTCELQMQYSDQVDYRFVDKALMVLGVKSLREAVEEGLGHRDQSRAGHAKR